LAWEPSVYIPSKLPSIYIVEVSECNHLYLLYVLRRNSINSNYLYFAHSSDNHIKSSLWQNNDSSGSVIAECTGASDALISRVTMIE